MAKKLFTIIFTNFSPSIPQSQLTYHKCYTVDDRASYLCSDQRANVKININNAKTPVSVSDQHETKNKKINDQMISLSFVTYASPKYSY